MKKYWDWIVANKVKTGFIVFGLFILPLILIHLLYKWITPHYLLQSSWSSGELITYIAGFEAFIGTVFLGFIAIHQNDNAIGLNNRLLKIEEMSSLLERCPSLDVTHVDLALRNMSTIFEISDAIFCEKSAFEKFERSSKEWKDSFFLCKFAFANHSSSSIFIDFQELNLFSETDRKIKEIDEFFPLPLRPNRLHVSPKGEKIIGFVFNLNSQNDSQDRKGALTIKVYNNIADVFTYHLTFILYVTKGSNTGLVSITDFALDRIN